jgi:hypothetical protein
MSIIEVNVQTGEVNSRELSEEELADIVASQIKTPEQIKEAIQAEINQLEATSMMIRGTREALLQISTVIAASGGVTESQLYAGNLAYRKMKDLDEQVKTLRHQL